MRKQRLRDCHLPKVTIWEQIPRMLESKAHVHSRLTVSQRAVPFHSCLPTLGGVTHPEGDCHMQLPVHRGLIHVGSSECVGPWGWIPAGICLCRWRPCRNTWGSGLVGSGSRSTSPSSPCSSVWLWESQWVQCPPGILASWGTRVLRSENLMSQAIYGCFKTTWGLSEHVNHSDSLWPHGP